MYVFSVPRESGRSAVHGRPWRVVVAVLTLAVVMSGQRTPAYADLGDQLSKLLADDGAADDVFGNSVGISGTTAIVGAVDDGDNGFESGSAYLFDISDPAKPTQLFKLLAKDGAAEDGFGVSSAISGTTAIVGTNGDDDNGAFSGSAYLFDITTGLQIAKLLPKDGAAFDVFGATVAISDDFAIVGALRDDDNGDESGSAYLFDVTTGLQIAKLLPKDGAAGDNFGAGVAISGPIAIVGARLDDDNGDDSGSAYLFDISDPAKPMQIAKLLPDDGAADDLFGRAVAISGATAIVGAFLDDDNGDDSGSAYLFDITTGLQIAKLLPDDGTADDFFGISVAIKGAIAIVGAYQVADNAGSAYVFDVSDPTKPMQIAKLLPDDGAAGDFFGWMIGISGLPGNEVAIVAAPFDDENGTHSGSAYLFDVSSCPADFDNSGSVGVKDLLILLGAWGPCPPKADCPADFDASGDVGVKDLLFLLGNWGPCP